MKGKAGETPEKESRVRIQTTGNLSLFLGKKVTLPLSVRFPRLFRAVRDRLPLASCCPFLSFDLN